MLKAALGSFLILVTIGCGGSKSGSSPRPSQINPGANVSPTATPTPTPGALIEDQESYTRYCPPSADPAVWGADTCFPNIKRSEIPAADDYFKWFEASWKAWDTSLVLDHTPKLYLQTRPAAPDHIEFIDDTKGAVPGIEKLKGVFPEMLKRCPSMAEGRFKAPLIVRWKDSSAPGTSGAFQSIETQLNDNPDGSFRPVAPLIWSGWIEIKGEYKKSGDPLNGGSGYSFPKQTFLEKTEGKSWAEGARALYSLDQTFSHEYGHFLAYAWAVNNGRSPIQSFMFSEFLAELIRSVCWGDVMDDPTWMNSYIDSNYTPTDAKPFISSESSYRDVSRRGQSLNYALYSLEKLIVWQKYHGIFDSDRMFRAIFDTMEAMTGRIIKEYPAFSSTDAALLTPLLPWSRAIDNKGIIEKAPMMFTRQEFLEKFCEHYPCGELEYLVKADAEGNRKTEW
ncbi:MAG: hypothetical protein M3Q07_20960 [Pseudobdellovibrionaceae bacterium]|nr:hypothetical protein [Pseudobdellovibrionaceae bacterium]